MDIEELRRDVKLCFVGHDIRTAADGVNGHLVAAFDREHRLEPGFEETPMTGFGT
jgi:hypothetical protein